MLPFQKAKEIFDLHEYKEGVAEMSGKLIVLLEILNESLARGDKLLVFRFVQPFGAIGMP